ncbi:MAG TPA: hypothetical protein VFL29_05260 [Candidatus Dormibacteraeota bacterium]|nr:hypothetical protein [Candidatus Dormibacteraeota bacterium]
MAALIAIAAIVSACGSTSLAAQHRSSPAPSGTASVSASAAPTAPPPGSSPAPVSPLTGQYGLLIAGGKLELIKSDATVFASTAIADSSVGSCSANSDAALQAPPVSASRDQVYFRDGDTRIREVVPPSSAVDVTTVPGSASVVSFFSVSPDDKRIAVLVEDLSGASTISLRLYVEDLVGHGHHADIYTTSFAKGKSGATLWPMGWHAGALVLALVAACSFEPAGLVPDEWHVSSASTAVRIATIKSNNCALSFFPSPAGVGCSGTSGTTTTYGWDGKVISVTGPGVPNFDYAGTALSPAGNSILFSIRPGIGAPAPATRLVQLGPGPYATVQGHSACLWIDEDHVLAPDAVIQFPAETGGNVQVNTAVTPLPQSGVCAGRFPGGL